MYDAPTDAEVSLFEFSPAGGWVLVREDGTMAWERLPSSLEVVLKRRTKMDSPVVQLSISGIGGWFVQFQDCECLWDSVPPSLVRF